MIRRFVKILSLSLAVIMALSLIACGNVEEYVYMGVSDYIINSDDVLRLNAETTQESLDALKVGDTVTLGTYDLNNNAEDGVEALTWSVLAIENGKALVIADLCVDAANYNSGKESVTWETSDLRAWLNSGDSSFYATSFDEPEKGYILLSDVENKDSSAHDVVGGNDTEDYLFLLSFDEVEEYFADDEARIAKASATAVANGGQCFDSRTKSQAEAAPELADDYMALTWWLRTPGNSEEKAATVHYFGEPNPMGARADLAVKGVRPAMWVRTTNEVLPEEVYTVDNWSGVKAGDKISFGSYEQDGDDTTTDAVIWQVLKVSGGKATLISEKVLDKVLYYDFAYSTEADAGATAWDTSDLRTWMDSTFAASFSDAELAVMVSSTLENPANGLTGAGGCADTEDLIYVLSSAELKELLPNVLDRRAEPTDVAVANGVYVDAQSGCADWWLRDVGETANQAENVFYYGGIDTVGKLVKSDYVGVRPVITVDITK